MNDDEPPIWMQVAGLLVVGLALYFVALVCLSY